ncbi:hypothetical protein KQ945_01375 [Bacillus subtilis subsp. subtilis]|nr:hypothetical protein [Bacillus subtilis subsp. subtilis]
MMRPAIALLALALVSGCRQPALTTAAPPVAAAPRGAQCLASVMHDLQVEWPANRVVNIVAFGHSVPAGFGVTPTVHKRDAYPRLLEDALIQAYPHAVLNVITAAVGGENSTQGVARFQHDALDHHPRVVLIDYGLNDRALPLEESARNLTALVDAARAAGACPVLLTPTWDAQVDPQRPGDPLGEQAAMIRRVGASTEAPVADSLAEFEAFTGDRAALMAQFNHPNRAGHELVLARLMPLFLPAGAAR